MGTPFTAVYNRFLGKITDDLYVELTPQDTLKDLQNLLIDAIPGFEFPRKNLYDYKICTKEIPENEVGLEDFVIGSGWEELPDINSGTEAQKNVIVDRSVFATELDQEEINILALLMKAGWIQRQVSSIENTRMKYSGSDFKFTSQANHLSKLLNLLSEANRESFHLQRLYKRRKANSENGIYESTWSQFRDISALD